MAQRGAGYPSHPGRLSTVKTSPKFSFSGRPENLTKAPSPGPGAYNAVPEKDKYAQAPSHGFGRSPRLQKSASAVPGPGQYEPSLPRTSSARPGSGFGTSPRANQMPLRSTNPGPGSYDQMYTKTMGQDGPRHAMSFRHQNKAPAFTPGPGAYECPPDAVAHASQRKSSPRVHSPRWGFGTSQRATSPRSAGSPGPGAYSGRVSTGANGPKFSISPKRDSKKIADTPGPGAYESNFVTIGS